MFNQKFDKGEMVIYKTKQGPSIKVRLKEETVWLDTRLMASLFAVNRPAVVKHINNVYLTKELDKKSTCSILEQVAADGKIRKVNFYNLDMIIAIGYRVNSKNATQFRIWATNTLKNHLVKGYTLDEKRLLLAKNQLQELQEAISFLQEKSRHELLVGQESEILNLLARYSKTLTLLEQYDTEKLSLVKKTKGKFILTYEVAWKVINGLKIELLRP